jgi:hypothetical protein
VYQLEGADAVVARSIEGKSGFKCSHFGAGSVSAPRLAVGTFDGKLQLWDLEQPKAPLLDVQAHASIVNAIDAYGGQVSVAACNRHKQLCWQHTILHMPDAACGCSY